MGTILPFRPRSRPLAAVVPSGMLLNLHDFEAWLRSWGAAERTISERIITIRALMRDVPDFPRCDRSELLAWLGREGLSQWTRVTYRSHVDSALAYAMDAKLIEMSPLQGVRKPRAPQQRPRPLTAGEAERLLAAASGDLRTWLLLALCQGLRVHEVAQLRGQDFADGVPFVRGKGGKDAVLPVHPDVERLRAQYPATGWWFPSSGESGHISRITVTVRVSRLFASLGIEGGMHRCRHTFGTCLLRGGANIRVVQTLMRHSSLTTTQGYLAVDEDERVTAVSALRFGALRAAA